MINCDEPSLGNLGPSTCGDIARDYEGHFLGAFAHLLGVSNSLIAELSVICQQLSSRMRKVDIIYG